MYTLYCHHNYDRLGGTLRPITRLLSHFYNVDLKPYRGEKRGVYLGHNFMNPKQVSRKMRRVVFVGGARPADHGIPRKWDWKSADHVVFISKFFRQIAKTQYELGKSSVIHLVGGTPSDDDLTPIAPFTKSFSANDEIHFMICAKWAKRYFKRYRQHIVLFQKHIQPCYPNSILHILGKKMDQEKSEGDNIISYRKDFHSSISHEVYKKADIQIILTPFDTGPMTVNESMHYRVPFICGNNSAAEEFISKVEGKCGAVVLIDQQIRTARHCRKIKPMVSKKYYGKKLDNGLIMKTVHAVVQNYSEYTSWKWTDKFSYKAQADKWMKVLFR